jgi:hypothetical protein
VEGSVCGLFFKVKIVHFAERIEENEGKPQSGLPL